MSAVSSINLVGAAGIEPRLCYYHTMPSKDKAIIARAQKRWYEKHKQEHKAKVATRNKLTREIYRTRILSYLKQHPCLDCGESDPVVLDFDHVDETTKTTGIAIMVWGLAPWHRIETEIAKCVVRCSNCHRRRTAKQFGYWRMVRRQGLEP